MIKKIVSRLLVTSFFATTFVPLFSEQITLKPSSDLRTFKADRPDFSSDNQEFVAVIDKELLSLRSKFGKKEVNLRRESVRKIAPKLADFCIKAVELVAEKAGIDMPGVSLHLADDSGQFNAAARNGTQINTTVKKTFKVMINPRTGKEIRRQLVKEEHIVDKNKISNIVIGAELLRLCLWRQDNLPLLAAIIGHEAGHVVYAHTSENPHHEHEADIFAVRLLKDGTDLMTALDMVSLAAHTFNGLQEMIPNKKRLFDVVRAAVNRIVLDVPNLGELAVASSHAYVATVIKNALQKIDKKTLQGNNQLEITFEVYKSLKVACESPEAIFGGEKGKERIKALCAQLENTAYLKSIKKTHPTPLDRNRVIAAVVEQ